MMTWEQPDTLIEIGSYSSPWQLQLARGLLESAGLYCFVPEQYGGVHRGHVHDLRLMVRATDAQDAQSLLQAGGDIDA